MTEEAGEFAGLFYEDANSKIIERLTEVGALLKNPPLSTVILMTGGRENRLFSAPPRNGLLRLPQSKKIL